jgi:hypothetical protein
MNESNALDWTWFTSAKGTVGIAKVKTYGGKVEYRISAVDGFLEGRHCSRGAHETGARTG